MLRIAARSGQDGFEARLLFGQFVKISVRFGVGGIDGLQLGLRRHDFAHAGFDFLAHGFFRVKPGFLFQIADVELGLPLHFAVIFLVRTGHDA